MREWIDNLKVGDKVIISPHWHKNYVDKVKRITKTFIITDNDSRFNKTWGHTPGLDWTGDSIQKYTPEKEQKLIYELRKSGIIDRIQNVAFSKFPLKALEKINNIINKEIKE